jgi:hypothetical protein
MVLASRKKDCAMGNEPAKKLFYCPQCGEKLSFLNGTVVKMDGLLAGPGFSVRTQFYFPSELGQYGVIVAGAVEIREGARVEFLCPNQRCNANYSAAYSPDLAEIRMVDEGGRDFVVVFHKVYGRRATFVVDRREKKLVNAFGEHAPSYTDTFERPLNFFGAV